MPTSPATIQIGDTIRISVLLIRQISEEQDGLSIAARVVEISEEPDRSKVIHLQRIDY